MAIKLTAAKPDDLFTRMDLILDKAEKKVAEDKDGNPGWIEFWSDDAKACKDQLKRIGGRLYVLTERRDKRREELSEGDAVKELEEYHNLIVEGLAHRVKDWRLVNSEGDVIEAPVTFENAKALFGDDDHDLRELAQAHVSERRNFTMRASKSS